MAFIYEIQEKGNHQSLEKNYEDAMKDISFAKLIKRLELTPEEAKKITSKLQDTIKELKSCEECLGVHMCPNSLAGHVMLAEKKEGSIYFSYAPCRYQKEIWKSLKMREDKSLTYQKARMKDIDMVGDKNRIKVIKWIDQFFSEYDITKEMKGLYLHGSFGSGKTFLISALFHELELTKHITTKVVYFPEALRTLKDDWEVYEARIREYQTVDLLLLDDIGAEKVTEWGRDEVLGTILQYRMSHYLPTFFTSNMNLEELEKHLASTFNSVDAVKSRRIIERIKFLAEPMELISENRRK